MVPWGKVGLLCVTASVSRLGGAAVCDSVSQQAGRCCCV
jgi:hypothetical protein